MDKVYGHEFYQLKNFSLIQEVCFENLYIPGTVFHAGWRVEAGRVRTLELEGTLKIISSVLCFIVIETEAQREQ